MMYSVIFFHLLNGFLLVSVIIYIIKKYMIPGFYIQKIEDEAIGYKLTKFYEQGQKDQYNVQKKLEKTEAFYHTLEEKMLLWKEAVNVEYVYSQNFLIDRQNRIQHKKEQQQYYFNRQKAYTEVLPHIQEQLTQQCMKEYNEINKEQFVHKIINQLKGSHE